MIISYSKNILVQIAGIITNNFWRIFFFTIAASIAHILHVELGYEGVKLPVMPVTLLGGALAIFLGFRNSSAYDRWWEARKVWGEIVNRSRSLAMQILTYSSSNDSDTVQLKAWQKAMIYRHIGWVYALKLHLHSSPQNLTTSTWFTPLDIESLSGKTNIPAQVLAIQGQEIKGAFQSKWIEDFRQYELIHTIESLYDCQGKCERIKNTVFPFYYNYFTQVFLWLFIICLPFALVGLMGWVSVPMSISISFVFTILDKSGIITEEPFKNVAADTPMQTLARNIEIDLREMINDENIPGPQPISKGKYGVLYRE